MATGRWANAHNELSNELGKWQSYEATGGWQAEAVAGEHVSPQHAAPSGLASTSAGSVRPPPLPPALPAPAQLEKTMSSIPDQQKDMKQLVRYMQ